MIDHRHGILVKDTYNKTNAKFKKQCQFINPPNMSHNYWNTDEDILLPILKFAEKMKTN